MKPLIVLVDCDKDGYIKLKKDEFEKYIQKAYDGGYEDGKRENHTIPNYRSNILIDGTPICPDMTTSTAKPYKQRRFCEVTAENADSN